MIGEQFCSGFISPSIEYSKLDFPLPMSPRIIVKAPLLMFKLILFRATIFCDVSSIPEFPMSNDSLRSLIDADSVLMTSLRLGGF